MRKPKLTTDGFKSLNKKNIAPMADRLIYYAGVVKSVDIDSGYAAKRNNEACASVFPSVRLTLNRVLKLYSA